MHLERRNQMGGYLSPLQSRDGQLVAFIFVSWCLIVSGIVPSPLRLDPGKHWMPLAFM